jgi:hypothetical protein
MMVARVATGSADRGAWLRRIYAAARDAAPSFLDLADEPPEGRASVVASVALAVATLCDWQSDGGRTEFNFNPGWVAAPNETVPFFVDVDGGRTSSVAAFGTLREGITSLFQVVLAQPRVRDMLAAGFVAWARWAVPASMDPPPQARSSFDAYLRRASEVAAILLQPPFSQADIDQEWEAWQGNYVSGGDDATPAETEPSAAPPRVVRPGYAYSATLRREVPNGACVQSARDRLYYQARAGEWALCPGGVCPATCVERYPLREGSGSGGSSGSSGSSGSGGSSVGPFLLLGAGWALYALLGR